MQHDRKSVSLVAQSGQMGWIGHRLCGAKLKGTDGTPV